MGESNSQPAELNEAFDYAQLLPQFVQIPKAIPVAEDSAAATPPKDDSLAIPLNTSLSDLLAMPYGIGLVIMAASIWVWWQRKRSSK
jgi:hypothetical protein